MSADESSILLFFLRTLTTSGSTGLSDQVNFVIVILLPNGEGTHNLDHPKRICDISFSSRLEH